MSYEIKIDKAGKLRFNLKAGNGQVILSSEGYADKAGALGGIASVQKNGPDAADYEKKTSLRPAILLTQDGEWAGYQIERDVFLRGREG